MNHRMKGSLPAALLLVLAGVLLPTPAGAASALRMGAEIHVNVSALGEHTGPSVAVFPDGGFVVAWTVGPRQGHKVIHARLFDKSGSPTGGEFLPRTTSRRESRRPGSAASPATADRPPR